MVPSDWKRILCSLLHLGHLVMCLLIISRVFVCTCWWLLYIATAMPSNHHHHPKAKEVKYCKINIKTTVSVQSLINSNSHYTTNFWASNCQTTQFQSALQQSFQVIPSRITPLAFMRPVLSCKSAKVVATEVYKGISCFSLAYTVSFRVWKYCLLRHHAIFLV